MSINFYKDMNINILKDLNLLNNVNIIISKNSVDILKYLHTNISLSIFAMIFRSLRLYFDELVLLLNSHYFNFDVIELSKTWLGYDFKFVLNGYR